MMEDSDDYEIVSKRDIEHLKKEILELKRNPYGASDRGKELQDAMDRLNHSINKLIEIFEDAETDIIEEYQESKPAEKLNQILDQNETIAKTLLKINEQMEVQNAENSQAEVSRPEISRPEMSRSEMSRPDISRPEMSRQEFPGPVMPNYQQPTIQLMPRPEIRAPDTFERMPKPVSRPVAQPTPLQPMIFNKPQIPLASQMPEDIDLPQLQPLNPRPINPLNQFQQPTSVPNRFQPQGKAFTVSTPNQGFSPDMIPLPPLDSNELPEKKRRFLGVI